MAAAEEGRIGEDVIDRSVRRVLTEKFRLGLFEDPFVSIGDLPHEFHPRRPAPPPFYPAGIVLFSNAKNGPLPRHRSYGGNCDRS